MLYGIYGGVGAVLTSLIVVWALNKYAGLKYKPTPTFYGIVFVVNFLIRVL